VEPEAAAEIVDAYVDGQIVLDRFRGRARDPFPVQVAEHRLRTHLALDGIDDVMPEHVVHEGRTVRVRFAAPGGRHVVTLERFETEPTRLTCHAEGDQRPLRWRLVSIDEV
jgi:hypothetical protein